jgi:hypothetical protein
VVLAQKTGTSKSSKNVQKIAISVDFTVAYQNLNSGSLRINGLNSSLAFCGKLGISSSSESKFSAGSIFGVKKARKRLR